MISFHDSNKKSEEEIKVLIQGDPAVEQAYEYYKKFCSDEELRRIDEIRQRHLHQYISNVEDAFEKGEAKGKLEGQVDSILTILKNNLKKNVPQRIVNALKTRTDSIALESLLVKAASCRSFEEFENELK